MKTLTEIQKAILVNLCTNYKAQNGEIIPISGTESELLMIMLSGNLAEYGFPNLCSIQEIEQATDLDLYFTEKYQ